jgi:glycine/D-amino acid oxidase-like deaminating enzyme
MVDAGNTIVVVGSGATGLSAALAAAETTASGMPRCRIVLIERAPKEQYGGNTRWSPSYMRMSAPDRVAPISRKICRLPLVAARILPISGACAKRNRAVASCRQLGAKALLGNVVDR